MIPGLASKLVKKCKRFLQKVCGFCRSFSTAVFPMKLAEKIRLEFYNAWMDLYYIPGTSVIYPNKTPNNKIKQINTGIELNQGSTWLDLERSILYFFLNCYHEYSVVMYIKSLNEFVLITKSWSTIVLLGADRVNIVKWWAACPVSV